MHLKRRAAVSFVICCILGLLIVYFTVNVVVGKRGLITLFSLKNSIDHYSLVLENSFRKKEALENKNYLLRRNNPDIDLLDEQVRAILGYSDSNEFVIIIDPQ